MNKKIVDTKEYVKVLRDLIEEDKIVSLLISGNSMSPFLIHERDYIYLKKPEKMLKRGDMVFFERDNGDFVMHRIYRIEKENYFLIGDAQSVGEGPIRRDQIFAKVIGVRRKGKQIGPCNFWWGFFEHVWIHMIPMRRIAVRLYSALKSKIR